MKQQFLALHALAITLHLLCAVYAFATPLAYTTPIPTELSRVQYNALEEQETYYRVAETWKFDFPSVILLHGIVALVTIGFHAVMYIPAHSRYSAVIWAQGYFPIRWIEYSITCTLMSISSIVSAGNSDFTTVLATVCFGIALQSLGAAIEQRKETVYYFLFVGGCINLGISVSTIWYIASSTGVTTPQVLEFLAYGFYYALFPINCIRDALYRKGCFVKTDWLYNVLSLTSKVGLFWLQVGEVQRKIYPGPWSEFQIFGLGIVFPLILLGAGVYWTPGCTGAGDTQESPPTSLLGRACTFRIFPPPEVVTITKVERLRPRTTGLRNSV